MTNYYNYYTFTGKIFKQGTNTPWSTNNMIMYMSPGNMFNATCGCTGYKPSSFWKVFDKDGIETDVSPHTSTVCNIGTGSCVDIYLTIIKPLIVLCSTSDYYDSTNQYSQPVFINIQGII